MRNKKEIILSPSAVRDIETTFRLVLPKSSFGLIENRVIDPNAKRILQIDFTDNLSNIILLCQQWHSKSNIYIGRNPRPAYFAKYKNNPHQRGGAHSLQIEFATAVSLDIDPVRPKGVPATEQEVQRAVEAALKISRQYPGSAVVMTGNGAQVLFPISPPFDVRGRQKWFEEKVKAWEDGFRQEVVGGGLLKLDPQFDLARIIKVPGTLSIKGNPSLERPHRLARFVTYPSSSCDVIMEILKNDVLIRKEKERVTFNLKPVSRVPEMPERFFKDLQNDKALQDIYHQRRGFKSASEYDLAMAVRLAAYYNYNPAEIHSVLVHLPSRLRSPNSVKSRAYYDITIGKAMAYAMKVRQQNLNSRSQNGFQKCDYRQVNKP